MAFKPKLSVNDLEKLALELVRNELILDSEAPAEILADRIIEHADPDFLRELTRSLAINHFIRLLRSRRPKPSVALRARLPEKFNQLPLWIVGDRGKRVRTDRATFADARAWLKRLGRRRMDQSRNDPRMVQTRAFRDALRKASQKTRGVTAGEALGFNFDL